MEIITATPTISHRTLGGLVEIAIIIPRNGIWEQFVFRGRKNRENPNVDGPKCGTEEFLMELKETWNGLGMVWLLK